MPYKPQKKRGSRLEKLVMLLREVLEQPVGLLVRTNDVEKFRIDMVHAKKYAGEPELYYVQAREVDFDGGNVALVRGSKAKHRERRGDANVASLPRALRGGDIETTEELRRRSRTAERSEVEMDAEAKLFNELFGDEE